MRLPANVADLLSRSGNIVLAENQPILSALQRSMDQLIASSTAQGTVWHQPDSASKGGRILVTLSGHAVLYDDHNRRILYADPDGTPLHECAWENVGNRSRLVRARVLLDWGQWVGIKPHGIVNSARFDISQRPGWQQLTREDLQRMAAQAMGVTSEDVAFFYDADSLELNRHGQVTVQHRKDALYVLRDGGFEKTQFMACLGAMHWEHIDFLPVVELFQSLLPGTGSAVFELIRGLYDDQNQIGAARPLRYRGIPTYPSPQAFQLFSTYFLPECPGSSDPFSLFMDSTRSAEVTWRPRPHMPLRFIDREQGLCVTVAAGSVQKVTMRDDPAALPFGRSKGHRLPPGGRLVGATKDSLQLQDGDQRVQMALKPQWGITEQSPLSTFPFRTTWRSLFPEGPPKIDAQQAYFAVPLYPDDASVVDETGTQSLAMDQIIEYLDRIETGKNVLIDQWDPVIAECLEAIVPRSCLILFKRPELAQRQAQRIWDHAAMSGDLSSLNTVRMIPVPESRAANDRGYELVFRWIPFNQYTERQELDKSLQEIAAALKNGSHAIVAGPPIIEQAAAPAGLMLLASSAIAGSSGAGLLRSILPHACIRPDATLFLFRKSD